MKYSTADVQNILTAFAEEFLVDIPALHNDKGYWVEHNTLAANLVLGDDEWYGKIAAYASGKLGE